MAFIDFVHLLIFHVTSKLNHIPLFISHTLLSKPKHKTYRYQIYSNEKVYRLYSRYEPDTRLGGVKVVVHLYGWRHGCDGGGGTGVLGRGTVVAKAGARLRSVCGLGCKLKKYSKHFFEQ